MKMKLSLILGGLLLLSQAAMAQSLMVSASVPKATGILLTEIPYNASTQVAGTPITNPTTIPFGTLAFSSASNTYVPGTYYGIAITPIGGAGTPVVNVTYTEGTGTACPNIAAGTSGSLGCLGTKTEATFVTDNPADNTETVSSLGKKRLVDLTGTTGQLPASGIPNGQYEKVYVGFWNGATGDPANGKPFTNADSSGTYTGTLTFTVVSL